MDVFIIDIPSLPFVRILLTGEAVYEDVDRAVENEEQMVDMRDHVEPVRIPGLSSKLRAVIVLLGHMNLN